MEVGGGQGVTQCGIGLVESLVKRFVRREVGLFLGKLGSLAMDGGIVGDGPKDKRSVREWLSDGEEGRGGCDDDDDISVSSRIRRARELDVVMGDGEAGASLGGGDGGGSVFPLEDEDGVDGFNFGDVDELEMRRIRHKLQVACRKVGLKAVLSKDEEFDGFVGGVVGDDGDGGDGSDCGSGFPGSENCLLRILRRLLKVIGAMLTLLG
ncbi:hypothetical protein F5884DRAFT_796181 [Xylogone sp. PMI_703]|nr:hypothetical protein F5884DRAFT_796181 [Xylogone sp. PMI_703]